MHRFDRMHLSPEAALGRLDTVDLEEKSRLAEGIALIAVIDHRRDYLGAGYSSMLAYCTDRLHMPEGRALRRIQVARVALRFPVLFECLADGRLNVATAVAIVPHLAADTATELLAAAAFKSRDEIVRLLAARSRRPAAQPAAASEAAEDVESSSDSLAPGRVNSLSDLCAPRRDAADSVAPAPAPAAPARRGRILVTAAGGHEVRLALTDEEHDDLRRAVDLLGHAVPSGDPALVYARAMKHYVAHLEKRRFGAKRAAPSAHGVPGDEAPAPAQANARRTGRGIPTHLRRLVRERDGGRCTFVGAGGHRCTATRQLEIDHVTPVAKGGVTTLANLRLLCRAHNQFEAERVLGKAHVQTMRELAQRERAQAGLARERARRRSAAKAEAARAPVAAAAADGAAESAAAAMACEASTPLEADADATMRQAALLARRDDILGALRGLGFGPAEANRGADLADAMPEASLEACIRHALGVLTRPVALRGERLARCSA